MPRSLLEILLEKKDPKKSLPYPTRDQFNIELENLIGICVKTLSGLAAIENFGGVEAFGTIREDLKSCRDKLMKYKEEWKDYPWNDPVVQQKVVDLKIKIAGDKPDKIGGILLDLKNARVESLGEGDSYKIANTYFETAESMRVRGTQKILRIASMRDKEIRLDRSRSNTDLTENNEINSEKVDITAKKGKTREIPKTQPSDSKMTPDEWAAHIKQIEEDNAKTEKDYEERKKKTAKLRMGMFYYIGMLLGETENQVREKWGSDEYGNTKDDPTDEEKKNRTEYLQKIVPFMERVTGKDFDDKNPGGDKELIKYIMVLGSYTPGYANYKADPEDKTAKPVEITKEEKEAIKKEMEGDDGKGGKKAKINDLIDSIIKRHNGTGPVDTEIVKQMKEAKVDLESVEAETACDTNSMEKLNDSKAELRDKGRKYKSVLTKDDIDDLDKIANILDEIFLYCGSESYKIKK
jgi:hypothetical protein